MKCYFKITFAKKKDNNDNTIIRKAKIAFPVVEWGIWLDITNSRKVEHKHDPILN